MDAEPTTFVLLALLFDEFAHVEPHVEDDDPAIDIDGGHVLPDFVVAAYCTYLYHCDSPFIVLSLFFQVMGLPAWYHCSTHRHSCPGVLLCGVRQTHLVRNLPPNSDFSLIAYAESGRLTLFVAFLLLAIFR